MNEVLPLTYLECLSLTFLSMCAGLLIYHVALRLQKRDAAKVWDLHIRRARLRDLDQSTEEYRQFCERENLRLLARKVRPE